MTPISAPVQTYLAGAGWFPGRRVSMGPIAEDFAALGVQLRAPALPVIAEFDKLRLWFPHWNGLGPDELLLDAVKGAEEIGSDVEVYELRLQTELTPIGLAYSRHYILFVSSVGIIYGAFDSTIIVLGCDIGDALNRMFAGQEPSLAS
ncbi:MAG: SUKH-3 domain-containing protein [Phycisphaerae bacterium]